MARGWACLAGRRGTEKKSLRGYVPAQKQLPQGRPSSHPPCVCALLPATLQTGSSNALTSSEAAAAPLAAQVQALQQQLAAARDQAAAAAEDIETRRESYMRREEVLEAEVRMPAPPRGPWSAHAHRSASAPRNCRFEPSSRKRLPHVSLPPSPTLLGRPGSRSHDAARAPEGRRRGSSATGGGPCSRGRLGHRRGGWPRGHPC